MSLTIPDEAKKNTLDLLWPAVTVHIHLYTGTPTMDDTLTLATIAALEVTTGSYDNYAVQTPTWAASVMETAGGKAYTLSGTVTFVKPTATSTTINGWYATNSANNQLYFAKAFPSGITFDNTSDAIEFIIKYTLNHE